MNLTIRLCCRHNLCYTLWYHTIIRTLPDIFIEIYCIGFIALKRLRAETILDENDFWVQSADVSMTHAMMTYFKAASRES